MNEHTQTMTECGDFMVLAITDSHVSCTCIEQQCRPVTGEIAHVSNCWIVLLQRHGGSNSESGLMMMRAAEPSDSPRTCIEIYRDNCLIWEGMYRVLQIRVALPSDMHSINGA